MFLYQCTAWIPGSQDDEGHSSPVNILFKDRYIEAVGDDGCYRKCLTSPELGEVDIESVKFRITKVAGTH